MAALATSVLSSCHNTAIALSRSLPHGRIGVPAFKGQMQVPSAALFKNTVPTKASIGNQVLRPLKRVSLTSRESTAVRCSNREDATSAGEDSAQGLNSIEQSPGRHREGEQREAAEGAAEVRVSGGSDNKPDTTSDDNSQEDPMLIVTGLGPTTVTSAAPDADVSKRAEAYSLALELLDRLRELGFSFSTLLFGPDRERLPLTADEDKAILMEISTTGLEKARRWGEPQIKAPLDDVIKGSGFSPLDNGDIEVEGKVALISFIGTVEREPAEILRNVEEKLRQHSPDLTATLIRGRAGGRFAGLCFISIRSLVTFTLPEPLPYLLSFGSLLFCLLLSSSLSTLAIDLPPLSILSLWQHSITPIALFITFASSLAAVTAVAARYKILHLLAAPVFLPSAAFGSFGVVTCLKGLLPGKAPAIDLALASPLAALLTSSAITAAGFLAGSATQSGEVPADYILVPETIFAHSGPFMHLASLLASAVILPDASLADISKGADMALLSAFPVADVASRVPQLVMGPLVFGGLVALHASLMTLLPIGNLSGGRTVYFLFGPRIAELVSGAFIVGVGLKLALNNVNNAVWWGMLVLSWVSWVGGGKPLRDNRPPPGVGRTFLGCGLVAAVCTILLL